MEVDQLQVREYFENDEVGILRLYEQVFGESKTIDTWRWQFKNEIQVKPWITLALLGEEIVAQYCLMPLKLNYMGNCIQAGLSCDTMVRSDQRGRKWFTVLATRNFSYSNEKGSMAVIGFPNRRSYPGFMRDLGCHRVVNLNYYYFRLGLRKVCGEMIDKVVKFFKRSWIELRYILLLLRLKIKVEFAVSPDLPQGIEDLLREMRDCEVLSVWKDPTYLCWRYENHPKHTYLFHFIKVNGVLNGLAVIRNCGETITICDILHRTKDELETAILLNHVLRYYAFSRAQKVEFFGTDRGFFNEAFCLAGFKNVATGNFCMIGKVFNNPELEKKFILPTNWTIAYGDTDII